MPKIMEITQFCRYGFTLEHVKKVIEEHGDSIDKYIYILHDRDVYNEDGEHSDGVKYHKGEPKPPHIHVYLSFGKNDYKFDNVAKWFSVPVQYCDKIKGRRFVHGVRYAFHINAPEKTQYNIEEAYSNFDVQDFLDKEAENASMSDIIEKIIAEEIPCSDFYNYVSTSMYLKFKQRFDRAFDLVAQKYIKEIAEGRIRRCNMESKIDSGLYVKYKTKFENAYKHRLENLRQENDRNMTCVFITGPSETGKTTFAKELAKEKGLTYFVSGSDNDPLDGYSDQECIILDELRPETMNLSNLLKLLDPYTGSSVKSRYNNKYLQCQILYITTVLSMDDFFRQIYKDANEPIKQLRRRCQFIYRFIDQKEIEVLVYDSATGTHIPTGYMPNPVEHFLKEKPKTDEERFVLASEYLGSFGKSLTKTAEYYKKNASTLSQWKPTPEQEEEMKKAAKRLEKTIQEIDPEMKYEDDTTTEGGENV